MRRRLFDGPDQGLGEELHLLEGLAAPAHRGGCCSLAVSLQRALQACGHEVSYAQVMGQMGAAFMLCVGEGYPPQLALEGRDEHALPALREWGREGQRLLAPSPEAVHALCKTEIIAGRPLLALGWGRNPAEWSLIVGVQADDLLGYSFGRATRERRPAETSQLLALGETTASVSQAAAALGRAVPILRGNPARYDLWLSLLEAPEAYGSLLTRLDCFVAEQWLSACLADARDAAADYLEQLIDQLPEEAAENLGPAADCAARLAELAEKLLVPPDAVHRAHLAEDLDWRQRRRETLTAMRDLELHLHDLVRRVVQLAGQSL